MQPRMEQGTRKEHKMSKQKTRAGKKKKEREMKESRGRKEDLGSYLLYCLLNSFEICFKPFFL